MSEDAEKKKEEVDPTFGVLVVNPKEAVSLSNSIVGSLNATLQVGPEGLDEDTVAAALILSAVLVYSNLDTKKQTKLYYRKILEITKALQAMTENDLLGICSEASAKSDPKHEFDPILN